MRSRLLGGLAAGCLALGLGAQGRILRVPSQYRTIQAAMAAARDGDTIQVAPGTYKETVDFLGKDVRLLAVAGPARTTLDRPVTAAQGSVVQFIRRESRRAVIEGFTIRGGIGTALSAPVGGKTYSLVGGGGILCVGSGPTIRGNHITGSTTTGALGHGYSAGAGILVVDGSPLIERNRITANTVLADGSWGGGIALCGKSERALVAHNLVEGNFVHSNCLFLPREALGGGIYADAGLLFHNTIVNNTATIRNNCGPFVPGVRLASARAVLVNSIVWFNRPSPFQVWPAQPTVTYCNVEGKIAGPAGPGNISADPRFVDRSGGDWHLRYDSPCRNTGWIGAAELFPYDFEGDPIGADAGVDMGWDEFHEHLYIVGRARRGSSVTVRLVGPPGAVAFLGVSRRVAPKPIPVPGLRGRLLLDPAGMVVTPLPAVSPQGWTEWRTLVPGSFPVGPLPMQGLLGLQLTNLQVVTIE